MIKNPTTPAPSRGSQLFDVLLARQSIADADAGPFEGLTDDMFGGNSEKFAKSFAMGRSNTEAGYDPWTPRTDLLRAAMLSAQRPSLKERLFDFSESKRQPGRDAINFRIEHSRKLDIPLQDFHYGPLAIPYRLANQIFSQQEDLLEQLNEVLGTDYKSTRPGLAVCLQELLDARCDFGQIYGRLRPWWSIGNFERVSKEMLHRKEEDSALRRDAILGHCVTNPSTPPRRVWDLYSNRVLPFHALRVEDPYTIPDNVWAVSHSWQGGEMQPLSTRINGGAWPVPVPKGVDLGDVRIELLNMGAEYVFLDILCLRQMSGTEEKSRQELRRIREWRLDVPTIGYVYQKRRTTIVYFNGLGLPLKTSQEIFKSDFHWFNRVWTLQEISPQWLPGGLAGALFAPSRAQTNGTRKSATYISNSSMTLHRHLGTLTAITQSMDLFQIIDAILKRKSTSRKDQVFGLVYLLRCKTLPTYDTGDDVEDAWEALTQNLSPLQRLIILVGWGSTGEGSHAWRPTWKQLTAYHLKRTNSPVSFTSALRFRDKPKFSDYEHLQYLPDDGLGYHDDSEAFYHYGYVIERCSIVRREMMKKEGRWRTLQRAIQKGIIPEQGSNPEGSSSDWDIVVWADPVRKQSRDILHRFSISRFRKPYIAKEGDDYILVGVANLRYWIVGRRPEVTDRKPGVRRELRRVGRRCPSAGRP